MKMARLRPWKEFAGTERLSFSPRSSTRTGAAWLDFSDRVDGYRGIRTTYRVNDEIPSQKLIPQYQYSNRFFIAAFSPYKQRVEWLDLGAHFGVDELLLLDEINAAQKPIIIQLPIYHDNVQEFTCWTRPRPGAAGKTAAPARWSSW